MTEESRCGGCTLCCKLPSVVELAKPVNTWCRFCDIGHGCSIYTTRPKSCATFQCFWHANEWMAPELRPDRCKVVFEASIGSNVAIAMVDPGRPHAWHDAKVQRLIEFMNRHGRSVVVMVDRSRPAEIFLAPGHTRESVAADLAATARRNLREVGEPQKMVDGPAPPP